MIPLTPHEERIVELVAKGWSHKRIAHEIGTSSGTVNVTTIRIAAKIGAEPDVRASIALAVWWGKHRAA